MNIISVFILGAIGGILRFSLETFGVLGTLCVNLIGSFALGFLYRAFAHRDIPEWIRNGLCAGLIGSFTTFSTFTSDIENLVKISLGLTVLYVVLSMMGGIIFCAAGERIAKRLQQQSNCNQQESRKKRSAFSELSKGKPSTDIRRDE